MKAIGGYFELADREIEGNYPVDGVRLNTARNALEYIIMCTPSIRHIYLPLYTCEAVIQIFKRLKNITYSFYHINERFEIAEPIVLKKGQYIIANNYFGIKDAYIADLAQKYGDRLIVDNAQALFAPVIPGIKAIYSPRKFAGVADGGFAVGVNSQYANNYYQDDSSEHDSHLLIRKEQGAEAGFKNYQQNECKLDNQPIRRMAPQTEDVLRHIDYHQVIVRRRANFEHLHAALKEYNQILVPDTNSFVCPMSYILWVNNGLTLRKELIDNKIFIPRFWPNILDWTNPNQLEYRMATDFLPLPVDQRYGEIDMDYVIFLIKQWIKR